MTILVVLRSISATEFEKNASKGFHFHVTNEHNVLDYLRLLLKLEHDFDGTVYSHYLRERLLLQAHPIGTFPLGRALVGHGRPLYVCGAHCVCLSLPDDDCGTHVADRINCSFSSVDNAKHGVFLAIA